MRILQASGDGSGEQGLVEKTEESRTASKPLARANGRGELPFPDVGRVGGASEEEGQGLVQMGMSTRQRDSQV